MPKRNRNMEIQKKSLNFSVQQEFIPPIENETDETYRVTKINISDIVFNDANVVFNSDDKPEDYEILAEQIKVTGLLNPIHVVKEGNKYKLLCGERRTKAHIVMGKKKIPAYIHDSLEEYMQIEMLFQENLASRHIDEGKRFLAYEKLYQYQLKFKNTSNEKTNAEIAKMMQISERSVYRLKQLAKHAEISDIEKLEKNEITFEEFKKRTDQIIVDINKRKQVLAKDVKKTDYYDKLTKTVYCVKENEKGEYNTYFTNTVAFMAGLIIPPLPSRKTFEEAQVDLDMFAANSMLEIYSGDYSEYSNNVPAEATQNTQEQLEGQMSIPEVVPDNSYNEPSPTIEPNINHTDISEELPEENTDANDGDEFDYEDVDEELFDLDNQEHSETVTDNTSSSTQETKTEKPITSTNATETAQHTIPVKREPINPEIADFYGNDSNTGLIVRGPLYVRGEKTYILTGFSFGAVTNNKIEVRCTAVEVLPQSVQKVNV